MKCADITEPFLDRLFSCELTAEEHEALCSHLAVCAKCLKEVRAWCKLELRLDRAEWPDDETAIVQRVPDVAEDRAREMAKSVIAKVMSMEASKERGAELPETAGDHSRPPGILVRVRLYRDKQPVEIPPENMDWVGKPGWELDIGIQDEGTYEVAFEGDRAPTSFGAKDMQEVSSQPGSQPIQPCLQPGEATEARSGPRGLFRLRKDPPQTTPSGERIPAKLRIIFSRNILRGPGNE